MKITSYGVIVGKSGIDRENTAVYDQVGLREGIRNVRVSAQEAWGAG